MADLDTLVPGWFICRQFGITKQTLGHWVSTGKLAPAGGRPGGPLYRFGDVLQAEKQTRRSPNSRRGTTLRPRSPVGAPA